MQKDASQSIICYIHTHLGCQTTVDQCWDLFGVLPALPKHHSTHASIPPQKTLVADG